MPETRSDPNVRRLRERVVDYGDAGYALLDGAWFSNISDEISDRKINARPLFLGRDLDVQLTGPWLVHLGQSEDIVDTVFEISGSKPCVVFWRWRHDDLALFKHLRKLNLVSIPLWAADGLVGPGEFGTDEHRRTVLFRHWDPRTLGALMPVLDESQFAQILDAAEELAFFCADYGGLKVVPRDRRWPHPTKSPLFVRTDQIEAMATRRRTASRRRIMAFLNEVAPDECRLVPPEQMERNLTVCEATAEQLGITREIEVGKWAYILAKNDWQADPSADRFRALEGHSTEDRLSILTDRAFSNYTLQG